MRVVSVPIESRYQGPGVAGHFRKSHFRPLRDLYRITSHVVAQVLGYGDWFAEYRRTRAHPPPGVAWRGTRADRRFRRRRAIPDATR